MPRATSPATRVAYGKEPFCWSAARADAEADFAIESAGSPLPVEVKAVENLKAKSLVSAHRRFGIERALRFLLAGYREDGWLANVSLWALSSAVLYGPGFSGR